jgi:hypothetical protein
MDESSLLHLLHLLQATSSCRASIVKRFAEALLVTNFNLAMGDHMRMARDIKTAIAAGPQLD